MHIADGILATEIVLAADAVSIGALYIFSKKINTDSIPRMGMMAAALFVASLIHFPLAGTSMHLGLFGLAGILLGWLSFPAVFLALLFQSLLFQHGGLLSIGINALNMGAGALAAYSFWSLKKLPLWLRAFTAGFAGIFVAALLMALEFQMSGYGRGFFYILAGYGVVAAIEGGLTVFIVGFLSKVKPTIFNT
jgi:cobalt/nickel transport system permease protein